MNCRLYDRGSHHDCREEQAEWVRDKEKANHCSYFSTRGLDGSSADETLAAQTKLEDLFGGKKEEPKKMNLDDIFKK